MERCLYHYRVVGEDAQGSIEDAICFKSYLGHGLNNYEYIVCSCQTMCFKPNLKVLVIIIFFISIFNLCNAMKTSVANIEYLNQPLNCGDFDLELYEIQQKMTVQILEILNQLLGFSMAYNHFKGPQHPTNMFDLHYKNMKCIQNFVENFAIVKIVVEYDINILCFLLLTNVQSFKSY
jgi:hypothetical protein